jgi:hypothetical protein
LFYENPDDGANGLVEDYWAPGVPLMAADVLLHRQLNNRGLLTLRIS